MHLLYLLHLLHLIHLVILAVLQTSSKDDSGIESLFSAIVTDYLETCRRRPDLLDLQTVALQGKTRRQSACCAKGR